MELRVRNISKKFGRRVLFERLNLDLIGGKIYGLIGRNGSGKTVLMRCLCGLDRVSSGVVVYNDQVVGREIEFLPSLGLIIETPQFMEGFTGFENLKQLALIRNELTDEEIRNVLEKVCLDPYDKRKVKHYSLGMKQKLAIAQAIMERPQVLLLDEPTNAIDRLSIEKIHQLLRDLKAEGALIIIASHHQAEINELSDEIIDMEQFTLVE